MMKKLDLQKFAKDLEKTYLIAMVCRNTFGAIIFFAILFLISIVFEVPLHTLLVYTMNVAICIVLTFIGMILFTDAMLRIDPTRGDALDYMFYRMTESSVDLSELLDALRKIYYVTVGGVCILLYLYGGILTSYLE